MTDEAAEFDDDPYLEVLAAIGRSEEQDERIAYHELGHFVIDRVTGTGGIWIISITPRDGFEGICRGARSEAFVNNGATGTGCLDASDVRAILAPLMPKAGESRDDKADVYASVFDSVVQLMGGEAAEQLLLGDASFAADDRRQAMELPALICRTPQAIDRFLQFCLQQALDLLSEHVTLLFSLGIILRMRRDMTGAQMDEAIASVLASHQVALERIRRRQWAQRVENAAKLEAVEMTRG
jgi:hypothetical protein